MPDPTPQNTFVIRFWWDLGPRESSDPQRWRGRIDHLQSGDAISFRDVREMLVFVERFVAPLELQSAADKEDA